MHFEFFGFFDFLGYLKLFSTNRENYFFIIIYYLLYLYKYFILIYNLYSLL